MRVHVVDPPAYTPAYDHALCAALARGGVSVELVTSRFAYAAPPAAEGYARSERFYRAARGGAGSAARRAAKLLEHVPDMVGYRARGADVVHFQWLTVPALDGALLPRGRPLVLTAHEPRPAPYARFDAVIAHSAAGRDRLVQGFGLRPERVHVVPHGAFEHLAALPPGPLPAELAPRGEGPVVLCFGLIRPYKGLDVLIDAWAGVSGAQLWVVGRPRLDIAPLRRHAAPSVRWVPRYVSEAELAACFRAADIVVAPYREAEQSGVVATALAFGTPMVLSDVGGLAELGDAARLVPAGDAGALREALTALLGDAGERARLSAAARALAAGERSWERIAQRTIALYEALLS